MNCITQPAAEALCRRNQGRLATVEEWDDAPPSVTVREPDLWFWTSTRDGEYPEKHVVRCVGSSCPILGPDYLDGEHRRSLVRTGSAVAYVGVWCVYEEADSVLRMIHQDRSDEKGGAQ